MRHWLMILAMASPSVWADEPSGAFDAGKQFGQQQSGTLRGNVSTDTAQQKIPNYNTDAKESGLFNSGQGSLFGPGSGKINNCATGPKADNNYNQQECDAVNFLSKNPQQRPQINIDKKDPLITGSSQIIKNAKPSGSFSGCKNTIVTKPAIYEEAICNEGNKFNTVDCESNLVVACAPPTDGCDAGGVIPNTSAGDMVVQWTNAGSGNYLLQFGSPGDNYFGAGLYDRYMNFQIKDVQKITRFVLDSVHFDDWLLVEINSKVVYVGPHGGDRLELKPYVIPNWMMVYCNSSDQPCGFPELQTSWGFSPNIDLKPYLINGVNTIRTRLVVGGGGEEWINISTRQLCPPQCDDQWNNQCAPYEARMRK